MTRYTPTLLFAAFILCAGSAGRQCISQNKTPARQVTPGSWLGRYDMRGDHAKLFRLPKQLGEASCLTMSEDGRLFCHDDELGIVYQLDYATGKIVKQFSLGTITLRGDFEDIAMKGEMMYLVSSNGNVFEFKEGSKGARVPYKIYKTFLIARNDVEGLVYDPRTDCLLLACKGDPGKGYTGHKAVYEFTLKDKTLNKTPRVLIPLQAVGKKAHRGQFNPSGIAIHPRSGTYFVISANGRSIIEMSPDGTVLDQREIPDKLNKQPEGIAFAPDLTMIICNDGQGGGGVLTLYPLIR